MSAEAHDDLILRHLDGETTGDEVRRVARLLADDPQFRARFYALVSNVARLREILDDRLTDSPGPPSPTEASMKVQAPPAPQRPPAPAPAAPGGWNIDFRRIYFNAVVGGLGGLLGWAASSLAESGVGLGGLNVYLRDAVVGLLVGVFVGFATGSTEGLVASRSLRRVWRGGRYGAGLGAVGGVLGLVLGEAIFSAAGGGVWPRAVGWGVFGLLVGTSEGLANRMPAKVRYGVLGGLLGGLVGGGAFEGLVALFRAGGRSVALAWGSAVGLVILGACIGSMIGLVESLLRKAWLFFLTGRLEGQTRTLDSARPHTIGNADGCTIVVPNDPAVAPVHAEIVFADDEFQVRGRDGAVSVRRDGVELAAAPYYALLPGDRVSVGGTRMIFRNVEGKRS